MSAKRPKIVEIPAEEFMRIARDLEEHHAVFYAFWDLGVPYWNEEVGTAGVLFDRKGSVAGFHFNPLFWKACSWYKRRFVICHECLHVILQHGVRTAGASAGEQDLINTALDLVVNHSLIERFGFDRTLVDPDNQYCWLDTVFPNEKIPSGQTFEYYYGLLKQRAIVINLPLIVDEHGDLGNRRWADVIDDLNESLSNEEKQQVKDFIEKHFQHDEKREEQNEEFGSEPGGTWTFAEVGYVAPKKKWESVIKRWSMRFSPSIDPQEQWARLNRRFVTIANTGMMIPTEMEDEVLSEPDRIQVWFFQDTSGSCTSFRDRFFAAAKSLNPERFDVKMHCFDTQVYETTLASRKLMGWGGTNFQSIENYIRAYCKSHGVPYPMAVFVITDGIGSPARPKREDRWYWFLSRDCRKYLPAKSKIFLLSDFE
jgi:predicted metal-dependent peptidase